MRYTDRTRGIRPLLVLLGICVATSVALPGARAAEQPGSDFPIRVEGAVNRPASWTVERLRRQFAANLHPVSYTLKGKPGRASCVALLTLIQSAHPRSDPHVKNHPLAFAVLVAGRDGYTACFSLAELSPNGGNHPAWIALDQEGHRLSPKAAPAELIVPGDVKPGRWVHGIARVELVDLRRIGRR